MRNSKRLNILIVMLTTQWLIFGGISCEEGSLQGKSRGNAVWKSGVVEKIFREPGYAGGGCEGRGGKDEVLSYRVRFDTGEIKTMQFGYSGHKNVGLVEGDRFKVEISIKYFNSTPVLNLPPEQLVIE